MKKSEIRSLLEVAVVGRGFTKRGDAFFRIVGDGVLQLLKFEYERCFSHFNLAVGLYSMYSEMERNWFTSAGCIPQYSVMNFVGEASAIRVHKEKDTYTFDIVSVQKQIEVLNDCALPTLDIIQTQDQLVEQMCELDVSRFGSIVWNDSRKYAPFLKSGNHEKAKKVIQSILTQQNVQTSTKGSNDTHLFESCKYIGEEDQAFMQKLDFILTANNDEIDSYLLRNKERNCSFARFCIPSK